MIFRKSSYCNGGSCVEVAWRKATASGSSTNCVEVAGVPGAVLVRDSKNPDGAVLELTPDQWAAFCAAIRAA